VIERLVGEVAGAGALPVTPGGDALDHRAVRERGRGRCARRSPVSLSADAFELEAKLDTNICSQ
jgi:hypothetical protein